jgi:two-component system, NarL family, nitrate/nitrite response regulator NarL
MSSQLLAESLARDPRFQVVVVAPAPNILSMASGKPGVVIISAELESGPTKGMHLARSLRSRGRELSIVLLLEALDREKVIASFRSGAKGVFCRTHPVSELHACIESVSQGTIWTGRAESEYLLEAIQTAPTCEGLNELTRITSREAEVAELAAQGLNNKQIARRLGLSEHTVKNHLFRLFDKLNVANRIELLFLMVKRRDLCSGECTSTFSFDNPAGPHLAAAAKNGLALAQLNLGLAHIEGKEVEKDDRAAYRWLRMAELSSAQILERSRQALSQLTSRLEPGEIADLERKIRETGEAGKTTVEQNRQGLEPCRRRVA